MYVLAIDQGTTGTTCVLVDRQGRLVDREYREIQQHYPQPGWVEHDPEDIWRSVCDTVGILAERHKGHIAAVGITNQRETTILWDRETGRPVHRAIVWQCRRTADLCDRLRAREPQFRERTGLPLDPYFSGTKIRWILDHVDVPDAGRLAFGTVDTWLLWRLTGGRVHATDPTNASRTLLYNLREGRWDEELCGWIGVPPGVLPEVRPSRGDFGAVRGLPALDGVPIAGVAGDQQAALFGQCGFTRGRVKNTYGTGCFLLLHTGDAPVASAGGLLSTAAASADGQPAFALEGSVFIAGAAIQWLRDEVGILENAADSEAAARAVPDNGGVYFVPAFTGLGAPHWDPAARGAIVGLTRGTQRHHLVRAALEAMAYQTLDVLELMERESGAPIPALAVDGGAAANDFLLQFQADLLGRPVERPAVIESTALGAAFLAGLEAGVWADTATLEATRAVERTFEPALDPAARDALLTGWHRAVRQVRAP